MPVSSPVKTPALDGFSEATRAWFSAAFAEPTQAQAQAWASIGNGENTLVIAPTGSGKTLAAFLWAIDKLATEPVPADPQQRCRVLYISPLKALAVDIERNLRSPLTGVGQAARRLGLAEPDIRVGVRTGDTAADERRKLASKPPDILITTPESLFLLLTSQARETLRSVETVIIDEVHALAGGKRGAHLALSLERLDALCLPQGDDPAQTPPRAIPRPPPHPPSWPPAGRRGWPGFAGSAGAGPPTSTADRAVRDRAAAGGGGHVPGWGPAGDDRAAAQQQADRAADRGSGRGHGRPGDLRRLHRARHGLRGPAPTGQQMAGRRRTTRPGGARSGRTSRNGCWTRSRATAPRSCSPTPAGWRNGSAPGSTNSPPSGPRSRTAPGQTPAPAPGRTQTARRPRSWPRPEQ